MDKCYLVDTHNRRVVMDDETTFIEIGDGDPGVYVCDNCGADATEASEIKHHATCRPGESKRWEKEYGDMDTEEGSVGLVTAFLKHYVVCLVHLTS
jgi:hypothetical protein